jgi:hypothetical protein
LDWRKIADGVKEKASHSERYRYAQEKSLEVIANIIKDGGRGIIIADEVGMGKTWVALTILESVLESGGTAAVVVPPGLMFQWELEFKKFKGEKHNSNPFFLRSYWDLFNQQLFKNEDSSPVLVPKKGAWCILSHRFGVPTIRSNSTKERNFFLPTIIKGIIDEKAGKKKNRAYQYYKKKCLTPQKTVKKRYHEVSNACHFLCSKLDFISEDSRNLLKDNRYILSKNKSGKNTVRDQYIKGNSGYILYRELLGLLIGDVDLLIIDEAHKSKDDNEKPTKILGELLECILRTKDSSSLRIGLTATPVELGADQWRYLLERIGAKNKPLKEAVVVIKEFSKAFTNANTDPDNRSKIEELNCKSKDFQNVLSPFVTRRRRIQQKEMKALVQSSPHIGTAHPHRNPKEVLIKYTDLDVKWKRMVLALEGMGKSAKGLKVDARTKLTDIRYASGLLSYDVESDDCLSEPNTDVIPRKHQRLNYFKKLASKLAISEKQDLLMAHPRVRRAATHIETILFDNSWHLRPEKVLVFGTYTEPMLALRRVLNARFVLRQIDQGRPILSTQSQYLAIDHEYNEICIGKTSSPFEKILKGKTPSPKKLGRLLDKSKKKYRLQRDKLTDSINEGFLRLLPGDTVLCKLNSNVKDVFLRFLRSVVLDELLYGNSGEITSNKQKIQEIAGSIWRNFLKAQMEKELHDFTSSQTATKWEGDDENDAMLDHFGDQLDPNQVEKIILNEYGVNRLEDVKGPASKFCRMLSGNTEMKTRRVLQAQFNRPGSHPHVLIAQSMVGREGLNLHEACRHIFLFHPEWNPATVEQQIGRVDRIESYWEILAQEYQQGKRKDFPFIEVEYLVFEGTYDQYQFETLYARRNQFNAQLFGTLIEEEKLGRVPEDLLPKIEKAAPDFDPQTYLNS